MPEDSDIQLLHAYAAHGDEAAFREIVRRHADLVYSAALRSVNSPDLARDLTQGVFTDLARKARMLNGKSGTNASLAGWLYRATRFATLAFLRDDQRRQTRERQAMEQLALDTDTSPDWDCVRPLLDEAMDALSDTDREAVLLRYFKKEDFHAVGLALGISEDAAQKRVSRALERLREYFARAGVTVGAGGLAAVIAANAVQAAPAGLVAGIATAAALTGASFAAATAATTTVKAIAMTTLQKILAVGILALLTGAAFYSQQETIHSLRVENARLRELGESLEAKMASPPEVNSEALIELERLRAEHNELLRLRGEVTLLRREAAKAAVGGPTDAPHRDAAGKTEETSEPVQTYVASATAKVPAESALLLGGWTVSSGKRVLVIVQPSIEPSSQPGAATQISLQGRWIHAPEDVLSEVAKGLKFDALKTLKADGRVSSTQSVLAAEQAKDLLSAFEKTSGVDILSAPRILTVDGGQAAINLTERGIVGGQEYDDLGPSLHVEPRVAADGSSVTLTVMAQIKKTEADISAKQGDELPGLPRFRVRSLPDGTQEVREVPGLP